jgi:hypothetical protein
MRGDGGGDAAIPSPASKYPFAPAPPPLAAGPAGITFRLSPDRLVGRGSMHVMSKSHNFLPVMEIDKI